MKSPLRDKACFHERDSKHLFLFATAEFHALAEELTQKNSLACLFSFISSAHGVNSVLREHPYIFILYENLRPTHKTYNMLSHAQSGHYIKTWGAEIFTRVLSKMSMDQEHEIKTRVPLIASRLADKLYADYKLHKVCHIYNDRFVATAQAVLARELGGHSARSLIEVQTVLQVGNEIIADMKEYFAQKHRMKYCKMLTFFGADFDTKPAITSSDILRDVLPISRVVGPVANCNMRPAETACRDRVFKALNAAITEITSKLEEEEIFANKTFAWYCILQKLRQIFCEYFTISALNRSLHIVKQLDCAYRKSIRFGDCLEFFTSFKDIKDNFPSLNDRCVTRLFSDLADAQRAYTVVPHSELTTEIRNCVTGYKALRVAPLCTTLSSKLQKTGHKISAGASSLRSTTILETNAFLQNIRKKLCKTKTTAPKRLNGDRKNYGSTLSICSLKMSGSLEKMGCDNDNLVTFTSHHKRKTMSWRRHLLKKAGKLLGIKRRIHRSLEAMHFASQDNVNTLSDANIPVAKDAENFSATDQVTPIEYDNNPFSAHTERAAPLASNNLTDAKTVKTRKKLRLSFGKSGKKLRESNTTMPYKNAATPRKKS